MPRERPVPCINATAYEELNNLHTTWKENRICIRCVRTLDILAARRALNEQFDENTDG